MTKIKNGRLVAAAAILGVASLLSRLVGLVRERVFTTVFGAGDVFDAFVAAFRVPDLIFNLIVLGALSAAFIPMFTEKLVAGKKGEKEAFDFALSLLNWVLVVVGLLSIGYAVMAPALVSLIVPGFTGEKLELTIALSRVMALQPLLLAISFVLSGILNSYKRFVAYALAPIAYNVGIIIGVIYLVPRIGVIGLAWGVVLGAGLHLLIQLPSAVAVGWRWRPVWVGARKDMRELVKMMIPRVVGLAAVQVNLLVVTIIGSTLLAGSITVFHLANNVQHLPIGIFGIAFAQAAFPTLAEQIARKQKKNFLATLTKSFRYIMFFVIPVSLFFFLLRAQIIRVLFGDGAFDWEDTILTFETFGWLIISMFAQAVIPLLVRAFYVRKDTRTPVTIAVIGMAVNVGLAWWLAPQMGVQGLALAFSVAAILQMVLLLGVLHWQLGGFHDAEVLGSMLKIASASIVAGVVLQLLKVPVAEMVDMRRFWGVFTQLTITGLAGLITYLIMMWLFKSKELSALKTYIPGRPKSVLEPGTETPRFEGMSD